MNTSQNLHSEQEQEQENWLTSPEDRNQENKWKPTQNTAPLTEKETVDAVSTLNNTAFIEKFPRVDRTYADPPPAFQQVGLISFTPAKGSKPNKNGVYGFAKLRGNYNTPTEANQRAEWLIRNVDSYHQIYHTYVGRPFPLTQSSKYSAEVEEINIRKQVAESVSSNVKAKRDEEQKTIKEIKEKEDILLAQSAKAKKGEDVSDPYENYITLRVKKAQLIWTYLEHKKKLGEVKEIIVKTRKQVEELDSEHPDFINSYFEKYKKARDEAGLTEEKDDAQNNFMKYMVEDVTIPEIDELYNQTYINEEEVEEVEEVEVGDKVVEEVEEVGDKVVNLK
jgi:hypothetical protein